MIADHPVNGMLAGHALGAEALPRQRAAQELPETAAELFRRGRVDRPRPSSPAAFRGRGGCRGAARDTPPPDQAKPAQSGWERIATACFSTFGADPAVGGAAARRMDHGPAASAAELRQQPPHLPFAEADLLDGLLLGDQLFAGFVQRHQPVALSLCHQQLSLLAHPFRVTLSIGHFHLAHLGHYHLAATSSPQCRGIFGAACYTIGGHKNTSCIRSVAWTLGAQPTRLANIFLAKRR